MKRSRAFVEERRRRAEALIIEKGQIGVVELAEALSVSLSTVRRDLDWLEEQGSITRRYGTILSARGARPATESRAQRAKLAIERYAASLVCPGETIFVSASTTSLGVVPHIRADEVTVVTNNTGILEIDVARECTVLLCGGEIRPPRSVLFGELALSGLSIVSTTKAFVGCLGVSAAGGATSLTIQEVPINTLMMERSLDTYLLADSSKLGIGLGFKYADLSGFTAIITDTGVSDEEAERLRRAGAREIVRVEPCGRDEGALLEQ